MLLTIFSNYSILLCIFGFSYILKRILNKNKLIIENIDFFYGFIFLIFLSLFLNFFFPLKYFTTPVILIGITSFLICLKKKIFQINFIFYFIIILLVSFITYYGNDNVDSPMYHLQIIKWMNLYKINFGLSNLEIRLGNNSSWHSFIALLNLNILNFSSKYYLSGVLLSFVIYEGLNFKKTNLLLSKIFLYLSICYLFLFSYLHPFNYGVILNHLGNPERDIASMLLYILTIYLFLNIFEETGNKRYQNDLINIFIISSFICVTTRVTTIPVLFLVIYIFYRFRDYKVFCWNNLFILCVGFFWIIRSFILSGCLIFPIKQTCIETSWSTNPSLVEFYVTEAMRFTRTLPSLDKVNDIEYTLKSFDWLFPWFKNYFLTNAIFQINSFIIITIVLFVLIKFLFKKENIKKSFYLEKHHIIIFFVLIINFIFWMQAPETRYAWGLHLTIPCFFIMILIKNNFVDIIFKLKKNIFLINFFIIFLLFFSKSFLLFELNDFIKIKNRTLDFSQVKKIGTFDEIDVYFNNWKCADFKYVCVNTPKSTYSFEKKKSYLFIGK